MIREANRPRVFVDLAPLAPDGTNGGSRPFVLELLSRLLSRDLCELHLLVKRPAAALLAGVAERGATLHLLGEEIREPRRLLRIRRRAFPRPDRGSLRARGASLLFSPLGTAAFHERGLAHVAVAYDFQEVSHPDFFTPPERRRRRDFRADLRRATRVVAISEATRREGIERAGLDARRVDVIPPVVPERRPLEPDELHERLARLALAPDGFAVYPANFWPHKNHARLVEAVARAGAVPRVVLCGALDEARERIRADANAAGLGERIAVLPYLDDADVTALLQGARLLVFPSLFEGFGIPVLEAFRLGTPVVCSGIPALRELAGDTALFFDALDSGSIASALASLWDDASLRAELARRGAGRASAFANDTAVDRYAEVLSAALSRS
ncbi:MAG TPA: glycosyltransferase family 1 protein [Thermoanaerobaculia bacterium]|nr:glycosyltransferase family 1 protein [Thermoanaerobaculia bacterium]